MYILHSFQLSFVLSELTQQFAICISHIYFKIHCWQIMPTAFVSLVVICINCINIHIAASYISRVRKYYSWH